MATSYVCEPVYGWEARQDGWGSPHPASDYDRYHVRLWKVHKWCYGRVDVVGQAHVDTNFPHRAVLFEAAEEEAVKAFSL